MAHEEDTPKQQSGQEKPVVRRDKVVVTKVTSQELSIIKSNAEQCGMTRSDFIRARSLGYKPRQRLSDTELDGLRQLATCRTDMVNFANALHGLTDNEKIKLFRHQPTMLDWYEFAVRADGQQLSGRNNKRRSEGGGRMIAKAKAVAHGIRAMLYVSGESRNKKHPEKITRVCDNFMPQGMDATGIFTEMKFATMNHPNIKNNVIRMEISPAMEHTENFTLDDWRQLWQDFAAAFDIQEIRDKDGKVVSMQTNISGSKSSIWLHEESNSGIPHLHAIVSRVDEKGNINNDHAIHLRAQRAAEMIARQRGWTTAQHIHETNIPKVSACMEALRELDKWSWDGYQERLTAKGYELYLRKDKKDVIRGYVLLKGNTKFKASELGKGRNLTASRIIQTWEKLHSDKTQQVRPATKQPVVSTPKPSVPNGTRQKPQPVIRQNNPIFENYTTYKPNSQPTEFEHDGKTYNRYLPDKVLDFFNDEFDYRELANWQDLQNLAMAYFTLITSPYEVTSGGGGGGSQSDLKWGRDPKEDEIEFARRCAQAASNRIGRHSKGGIKRK